MYYKLKIEEVDYDKNTIKATEVWVTDEMLRSSHSIDVLKMSAEQLINKFRSDHNLKEPQDEYNVYRHVIESPMVDLDLEQF
jgi:DNA-binding protein Fis